MPTARWWSAQRNFTEALILGNIYSQMIQHHTDLTVDEKFNLDGTLVTMSALESGKIDMFTDYTGVIASNILKLGMSTDTDEVYRQVRDGMARSYDAKVSKPIGFSNTYVLAVTKRTSRELGITNLSQLVAHAGELRLGCTTAFTQREDLLPKMEKNLGVSFASVEGLEGNIRYQALRIRQGRRGRRVRDGRHAGEDGLGAAQGRHRLFPALSGGVHRAQGYLV